jgi:hypothetical protein
MTDSPAVDAREELGPLGALLAELRAEVDALRATVERLDADLQESRRLNLRAAELLDIVHSRLG